MTPSAGMPCPNWLDSDGSDHNSAYWQERNLIAAARPQGAGSDPGVPREQHQAPMARWDFFNELAGPKQAWFGCGDHIYAVNDVDREARENAGRPTCGSTRSTRPATW